MYSIILTKFKTLPFGARAAAEEISKYPISDLTIIYTFYGELNLALINDYVKHNTSLPLLNNSDINCINSNDITLLLWLRNNSEVYALINCESFIFKHIGRVLNIEKLLK